MSENAQLLAVINELTENTKNNVINWKRESDDKYTYAKPQHGRMTLERVSAQTRHYELTAFGGNNNAEQKLKANSSNGPEVKAAIETLWKAVTDDYGNDGVEFLRGFVKK